MTTSEEGDQESQGPEEPLSSTTTNNAAMSEPVDPQGNLAVQNAFSFQACEMPAEFNLP